MNAVRAEAVRVNAEAVRVEKEIASCLAQTQTQTQAEPSPPMQSDDSLNRFVQERAQENASQSEDQPAREGWVGWARRMAGYGGGGDLSLLSDTELHNLYSKYHKKNHKSKKRTYKSKKRTYKSKKTKKSKFKKTKKTKKRIYKPKKSKRR